MNDYIVLHPTWDESEEDNAYHFTHINYPFDLPTLNKSDQKAMEDFGFQHILDMRIEDGYYHHFPDYKIVEMNSLQEYKDIIAKAKLYGEASRSYYATDEVLHDECTSTIMQTCEAKL